MDREDVEEKKKELNDREERGSADVQLAAVCDDCERFLFFF